MADAAALEIYRIAQEAVANAMKHSGATRIDVAMAMADGSLELVVSDNGQPSQRAGSGIGRRTMRQRAAAVNGTISMSRSGDNTVVRLVISPLPENRQRQ